LRTFLFYSIKTFLRGIITSVICKEKEVGPMLGAIIRFVVSALVLLFVSFLVPGFKVGGFLGALLSAVVIAVLGYIVESLFGKNVSPQSRGVVGFLTAAAVIYLAQFIVPALEVSVLGALLAALVIGIVDAFVPTELR
jgi:putative membrane protein